MANYPNRAVKKFTRPGSREIATGIVLAYGLFPRTTDGINAAKKFINARTTWLAPSDLPDYYNDIDSDLMVGKETDGIRSIRSTLREFYGIPEPESKITPVEVVKPTNKKAELTSDKKEPTTGETQVYKPADKFVDDAKEFSDKQMDQLDQKLEETSDAIMDVVDALIEQQKRDFENFKRKQREELESNKKKRESINSSESKTSINSEPVDKPINLEPVDKPEPVTEPEPVPKRISDQLRELLEEVAKSDARALRETDELLNEVDEIVGKKPLRPKKDENLLPPSPTEPPKLPEPPENSNQYKEPIGPDPMQGPNPMQGPKEPPVQGPKAPPKKTVAPEKDEDWESEVPDQLGTKLDELINQVQKDPLPQPTPKKRRKTRGKKPLERKTPRFDADQMGITTSLNEILNNVVETREALFKLYKITKERFEFKKKIDKQLTASLQAKVREDQIESGNDDNAPSKGNGLIWKDKKDDEKKKKKSFLDQLISTAVVSAVSLGILPGISSLLNKDDEEKKKQEEEDNAEVPLQPEEIEDNEPQPPEQPQPPAAPAPLPNTSIRGDYDYRPPMMPLRAAATGGKFAGGEKKKLTPLISRGGVKKDPNIKKLAKPLVNAITLPQKAATLGMLKVGQSMLAPFSVFMPDSAKQFVTGIFEKVAKSSGLSSVSFNFDSNVNIFEKLKSFFTNILNSLLGGAANAGELPSGGNSAGRGGSGGGKGSSGAAGNGPGGSGQDFATLATIAALESGSAQGQADVAQSVYNRLGDTGQQYGKSITEILTRDRQYQVAFKDPNATSGPGTKVADVFKNIKTEDDAVKAIMYYKKARGQNITEDQARKLYKSSAKAISDPELMKSAAEHVGGRTEFLSGNQYQSGDAYRGGVNDNTFFAKYGSQTQMQRGAQAAPEGLFNEPAPVPSSSAPLSPVFNLDSTNAQPGNKKSDGPMTSARREMQLQPMQFAGLTLPPPVTPQPKLEDFSFGPSFAGLAPPQQPGS